MIKQIKRERLKRSKGVLEKSNVFVDGWAANRKYVHWREISVCQLKFGDFLWIFKLETPFVQMQICHPHFRLKIPWSEYCSVIIWLYSWIILKKSFAFDCSANIWLLWIMIQDNTKWKLWDCSRNDWLGMWYEAHPVFYSLFYILN